VGAEWAERHPPRNILVEASASGNAIARELEEVWLWPESGTSPYSGSNAALFPWVLAKAFLSSPAALAETVRQRIRRLDENDPAAKRELVALQRLGDLADAALAEGAKGSAKFNALV